ncbi:hypothetical protein [Tenacibaculum geojense]|uniref:WG repeat-containing protein n=1 Tax=Tenacibaculum geojense TaxID=915352 RepID=A0ABW3JQ05_9FLAO
MKYLIKLFLIQSVFCFSQSRNDVFPLISKILDDSNEYRLTTETINKIYLETNYSFSNFNQKYYKVSYHHPTKITDIKYGLYDIEKRKIAIPINYYRINENKKYIILESNNSKYTLLDKKLKKIVEDEYDKYYFNEHFILLKKNNLEGVYFFSCNCFKIPMVYSDIKSIIYHRGFIAKKNSEIEYYNEKGDLLFNELKSVTEFGNKFKNERTGKRIILKDKNNYVGLYDNISHKFIIPMKYKQINETYFGDFIVKKNKKYGVLSKRKNVLIDFKYDSIKHPIPFYNFDKIKNDSIIKSDLLFIASKNGKFGLVNKNGKNIVDFKFSYGEYLNLNFYKLKKGGKYFIFNKNGNKITEKSFDNVRSFIATKNDIIAPVFNKGYMSYINQDGILTEKNNKKTTASGYGSVKELYEQFVIALKEKEDSKLYDFCKKLVPDEYSIDYLERAEINIRNIPNKINKSHLEQIVNNNFKILLEFKNKLKNNNHLEDLKYVKLSKGQVYIKINNKNIQATDGTGRLISGDKNYSFKLGELLNIDGFWKSFTKPYN